MNYGLLLYFKLARVDVGNVSKKGKIFFYRTLSTYVTDFPYEILMSNLVRVNVPTCTRSSPWWAATEPCCTCTTRPQSPWAPASSWQRQKSCPRDRSPKRGGIWKQNVMQYRGGWNTVRVRFSNGCSLFGFPMMLFHFEQNGSHFVKNHWKSEQTFCSDF